MVMITLKKTHKGTQQKQWHKRLWRETRGFGIGFPFDRERKQCRDGGRAVEGRDQERKCWWHTAQINDITVQSSTAISSKWGHRGQDLFYWQQHAASLLAICVLMYRQALSQHGPVWTQPLKVTTFAKGAEELMCFLYSAAR